MTKGLFIEPPMTEAEAAARVTPGERAAAQEFLRERRRREFLTWRAVVRRELGDDVSIAYDEAGAPVIRGREVHIGVSHCPGHRSKDKRYSGDNRLIIPKSSYRRNGLAPRCRLVTSWGWRR